MVTASQLRADVEQTINDGGVQVRFRYFTGSGASFGYDNYSNLTQSGSDVWTSGLHQPLTSQSDNESSQAQFQEQGYLKHGDSRLYVLGDVIISGTLKIGIGSPVREEYQIIEGGVKSWPVQGVDIYHKLYIRKLTNGSLFGE